MTDDKGPLIECYAVARMAETQGWNHLKAYMDQLREAETGNLISGSEQDERVRGKISMLGTIESWVEMQIRHSRRKDAEAESQTSKVVSER